MHLTSPGSLHRGVKHDDHALCFQGMWAPARVPLPFHIVVPTAQQWALALQWKARDLRAEA